MRSSGSSPSGKTASRGISESGVHPLPSANCSTCPADGAPSSSGARDTRRPTGPSTCASAIAAMYPGATPDHVEVTNGGSEANCVLMMRLVEPGDEIVFMSPNYMQASGLARGLGAAVVPWPLPSRRRRRSARRGSLDLDELDPPRDAEDPRHSALQPEQPHGHAARRRRRSTRSAASPHGPAPGSSTTRSIAALNARRRHPHRLGTLRARDRQSSGLSKAYGLPGLRIGWVVAPPALDRATSGAFTTTRRSRPARSTTGSRASRWSRLRRAAARAHAVDHPRNYPIVRRLDRAARRA